MPRRFQYDEDEERLPHGMTRVGYDADTQVYTFQDEDGSYWESAPGSQYGQLTRSGETSNAAAADSEPFLAVEEHGPRPSWRHEMMPLLNFGIIVGLCFFGLIWYLHTAASGETESLPPCIAGTTLYHIKSGDTCWQLSDDTGITVDQLVDQNPGLNCDQLKVGAAICLPKSRMGRIS